MKNLIWLCIWVILLSAGLCDGHEACKKAVDVVLVVEDSSNLPDENAENALKNFLVSIVNYFIIASDQSRFAMELFNDQQSTAFDLNQYSTSSDVMSAILKQEFSRKSAKADVGSALNYANQKIFPGSCGERACSPAIVILVAYSSDVPNGPPEYSCDVLAARQIQNAAGLILSLGVGPNRDPYCLSYQAQGYNNYYDFPDFTAASFTEDQAARIANQTCQYSSAGADVYPCMMDGVMADVVFVVDGSQAMVNPVLISAVNNFVGKVLKPYQYGPKGVQASLVTYSQTADVAIEFKATKTMSDFLTKTAYALNSLDPGSNERNIYFALESTYYHALSVNAGYRQNVPHFVFIFSSDCLTGPDPVPMAKMLRKDKPAEIFMYALGKPLSFWKVGLEIGGDVTHFMDVQNSPEVFLRAVLPYQTWLHLCSGSSGGTTPSGAPTSRPQGNGP